MVPPINEIASPWKIGSNKITNAPITTVPAVNNIGVVRTAPASIAACFNGTPSSNRRLIKSISKSINNIEIKMNIKPIIIIIKKCPKNRIIFVLISALWYYKYNSKIFI